MNEVRLRQVRLYCASMVHCLLVRWRQGSLPWLVATAAASGRRTDWGWPSLPLHCHLLGCCPYHVRQTLLFFSCMRDTSVVWSRPWRQVGTYWCGMRASQCMDQRSYLAPCLPSALSVPVFRIILRFAAGAFYVMNLHASHPPLSSAKYTASCYVPCVPAAGMP